MRKQWIGKYAILAVTLATVAALASCGSGGGGGGGGGGGSSEPLMLKSDSGTDRSAEGTWSACYSGNTQREDHVYAGSEMAIQNFTGTSGAGCPGGAIDNPNSGSITLSSQTTQAIAGWLDGTGAGTTAPARLVGGGNLSDTPTASKFSGSGTIGGNSVSSNGLMAFVDDSGSPYRLWRDGDPSDCQTAYGSDFCLSAVDPLIAQ